MTVAELLRGFNEAPEKNPEMPNPTSLWDVEAPGSGSTPALGELAFAKT